jgi:hypothetical protein
LFWWSCDSWPFDWLIKHLSLAENSGQPNDWGRFTLGMASIVQCIFMACIVQCCLVGCMSYYFAMHWDLIILGNKKQVIVFIWWNHWLVFWDVSFIFLCGTSSALNASSLYVRRLELSIIIDKCSIHLFIMHEDLFAFLFFKHGLQFYLSKWTVYTAELHDPFAQPAQALLPFMHWAVGCDSVRWPQARVIHPGDRIVCVAKSFSH